MPEHLDNSLESTTVSINRTVKTVKGGRNLSFAALVVVGDRDGSVGIGYGKGRGVPAGIEKAQKYARKNLTKMHRLGGTIPHQVTGRYCASMVRLMPAAPGTGVIAGGTVRAVLEMCGIKDCLTKAYGSTNKINLSRAVFHALSQLRTREEIASLRGVEIESSHVDEILEANKRFMVDADGGDGGDKQRAKGPVNKRDEEAKASRGRGRRGGPQAGRGRGGQQGGRGGAPTGQAGGPAEAPKAEGAQPADGTTQTVETAPTTKSDQPDGTTS